MTTALSLHIGLNYVDPASYNGWNGELAGCINDAKDMQDLALKMGYTPTLLTDSDADSGRVVAELGKAAGRLQSGDILFVSYSGHGGQVDDVNNEEEDRQDETWCLWDRQLIDDELFRLWSQFNSGVRIVVLSDSCHSGTVLRMLGALESLQRDLSKSGSAPSDLQRSAIEGLTKALEVGEREAGESATTTRLPGPKTSRVRTRGIPPGVQEIVNRANENAIAAAQYLAGPAEKAAVEASVILISGCQDDQLSADGDRNGLFTETLKSAWNSGDFKGDYRQFCETIRAAMPKKQQPNYLFIGKTNPAFESQKPFNV